MRAVSPFMILTEETLDSLTFRFNGDRWAVLTLIPGVVLMIVVCALYLQGQSPNWLLLVVGMFGLVLLYSTIISVTGEQWLTVNGSRRTIRFYKKTLYGLVDWERSAPEFECVKVSKNLRSKGWRVSLICNDGDQLFIGEHELGEPDIESAINIATRVSNKTGIIVRSRKQVR